MFLPKSQRQLLMASFVLIALGVLFLPTVWRKGLPIAPIPVVLFPDYHVKVLAVKATNAVVEDHTRAWSMEVGTYHGQNLQHLLAWLNQKHFPTYLILDQQTQLTKVYIGPDLNKSNLQSKAYQLRKTFHMHPKVVPYRYLQA